MSPRTWGHLRGRICGEHAEGAVTPDDLGWHSMVSKGLQCFLLFDPDHDLQGKMKHDRAESSRTYPSFPAKGLGQGLS